MLKKNYLNNMIAIMPMAGRGQRFKDYGYETPKPLIKVGKKPMFAKATESFPKRLKWIFISQKKFKLSNIFKKSLKNFQKAKVIYLEKYTSGQANTVSKAIKFLTKSENIIIHSCDLKFNINFSDLRKKVKKYDVLVFTAKGNKYNFSNSHLFSWVRKKKKNQIEISLKKNFKKNKKKSRVLIGSFVFKNKSILNNCLKYVFQKKYKLKNEYYIDSAAMIAKKIGYTLGELPVKKYVSWGSHVEFLKNK
tara:strand:- start:1888 stop:2634 length:747 start_codon:yes stop_codon:yes gene_type:complete